MKDYIKIFNIKINRNSILYRTIKLAAKSGQYIGPILEPKEFDIKIVEIPIKNLPETFEGFKILHLSDIHASDYIREGYLKRMVEESNALNPDITVITGDFTETEQHHIEWSSKILAELQSKFGTFGVLGNHDMWNGFDFITSHLEENNIKILRNANLKIDINESSIYFAGIDDYKTGKPDLKAAMEDIPKDSNVILLSHNPDIVERISEFSNINLILSGHIHGGQWRFPLIGPLMVPSKHGRKHAWGLSTVGDTFIYTSRGIGCTSIPIRINCPPEIILVKLVRA